MVGARASFGIINPLKVPQNKTVHTYIMLPVVQSSLYLRPVDPFTDKNMFISAYFIYLEPVKRKRTERTLRAVYFSLNNN